MAQQISTNTFGCAKWVVSSDATQGTHTTIAGALTSASSGDTIFIRGGTYTENLTMKAGVDLTAFECDASTTGLSNVIISGKLTMTVAGTVNISGIQLQTNSDFFIAVTGSADSIINLQNCYLNCLNNTGISYTTSGVNSIFNIQRCNGDIGTTGIGIFANTSAGRMRIRTTKMFNTGASTTASTCSAGVLDIFYSSFSSPITLSSTSSSTWEFSDFIASATNSTAATLGGSSHACKWCRFDGGSASAVSIGSSNAQMEFCDISSTNTNAVTGAGSLAFQGMAFTGSSNTVNVTTQTGSGTLQGSKNTAPSAGFLGERISAYGNVVAAGSTGATKTITSISLTPGVWDISVIGMVQTGSFNLTLFEVGISTTTNTFEGNLGDQISINAAAGVIGFLTCDVPAFRVVITATTTYYAVARVDYAAGAPTVNARISGVRVG